MGGEAGRAPSGGLRSYARSRTGWGKHHHHLHDSGDNGEDKEGGDHINNDDNSEDHNSNYHDCNNDNISCFPCTIHPT